MDDSPFDRAFSCPPEETRAMLEEAMREWAAGWVTEGREQGLEQGRQQGLGQRRAEVRTLLCRLAARRFDDATAERLLATLVGIADPDRLAEVGDWIIECRTGAELLARVARRRS